MPTRDIVELTREGIADIIQTLPAPESEPQRTDDGPDQREHPRSTSAGTVEIRVLFSQEQQFHTGHLLNIGAGGLGMRSDHYFERNTVHEIVVHLPQISFHAKACVCYCKKVRGRFMTGMAFVFGA